MGMRAEILLYEGFEELDAFGPFEVLAVAAFEPSLVTLAPAERVTGAHNVTVVPHDRGAWGEAQRDTLPRAIAARHAAGTTLAGVCTGTMLIASAGLLVGRPAVTHRSALDDLAAAGAEVIAGARVVDDGEILTAGGVTAGIDLALRLVERRDGVGAAERAAEAIEYRRDERVHVGPRAEGCRRPTRVL